MKILLTGGHTGIGKVLAQRLAAEGHDLLFLLRDESRLPALDFLPAGSFQTYFADLADPDATRNTAGQILREHPKLDVLHNNAGILLDHAEFPYRDTEIHFLVNTLAPYVLLQTLRPALRHGGTVINTSSGAAKMAGDLRPLEALAHPTDFSKWNGPYAQSKLALSYWTWRLGGELAAEDIRAFSVDPGGNDTKMTRGRGTPWLFRVLLRPLIFKSPEGGANLLYRSVFEPPTAAENGAFLVGHQPTELSAFQLPTERGTELIAFLDTFL